MSGKIELLQDFRDFANRALLGLSRERDFKEKAKKINRIIIDYKEERISQIRRNVPQATYLSEILLLSYVCYIVMLEYRNKVWPYEYMAFSRRIGEIWEPFCKIPFSFPSKELSIIEPPVFSDVQQELVRNYVKYVSSLAIPSEQKRQLVDHYISVWNLVDSGNISLSLDLHFSQNGVKYNVDYKSGFGSNEKGNTNRLLQVGSIYSSLSKAEQSYQNLIFVRQPEDENNHYLQTLKNSPFWHVFCAEEAYEKIREFTGFDLKKWMADNMDWGNDISPELHTHLEENGLLTYLSW